MDIYLQLYDRGNRVVLLATNSEGQHIPGGSLLSFRKDTGMLHRPGGIRAGIGFKLDVHGRIVEG